MLKLGKIKQKLNKAVSEEVQVGHYEKILRG